MAGHYADTVNDDDGSASRVVREFIEKVREWQEKWRHVGAADTASEEAFAAATAQRVREAST